MFVITNYYKRKISIRMYVFKNIFNTFTQYEYIYVSTKMEMTSINAIHSRIFIRLLAKENMIRK